MKKNRSVMKKYFLSISAVIMVLCGLIFYQEKIVAASIGGVSLSESESMVQVAWIMGAERINGIYSGKDDSSDLGAQFMPTGKYGLSKNIAVCAIVNVSSGESGVKRIYSGIFYPDNVSLGSSYGNDKEGCGELLIQSQMFSLDRSEGINLFCDKIKNNNYNLPVFNESANNFDKFCGTGNQLENGSSAIFCTETSLAYNDPSGSYLTRVAAYDGTASIYSFDSSFTYFPLTAFETDFDSIEYGLVKAGKKKIVNGDLVWGNDIPTVRNVGNTRLSMEILQENNNSNKDDEYPTFEYGVKIEDDEKSWIYFDSGIRKRINGSLDLAETEGMDFYVFVYKFPDTPVNKFDGSFTLSAVYEDYLRCVSNVGKELSLSLSSISGPFLHSSPVPTPIVPPSSGLLVISGPADQSEISALMPNILPSPAVEPFVLPVPVSPSDSIVSDVSDKNTSSGMGNSVPDASPFPIVSNEPPIGPVSSPYSSASPATETNLAPSPETIINPSSEPSLSPVVSPIISPEISPDIIPSLTPEPIIILKPEPTAFIMPPTNIPEPTTGEQIESTKLPEIIP